MALSSSSADVLWLDDPRARDPAVTGAKASTLATAHAADFPIVPGFVLSTSLTARSAMDVERILELSTVRDAWSAISRQGAIPLIVRSSSTVEDSAVSSMAGIFESVAGVTDWSGFCIAVAKVRGSSNGAPMAVLVQREIDATRGGVAFGLDPISGRADRKVIAAIDGPPGPLVNGRTNGTRYTLSGSGRVVQAQREAEGSLTWPQRRRLVVLSKRAADLFGSPQDIEWAFDRDGELWMLQSRPITASARATKARGPLFGPGPIAETFPDALAPLEQDLWIEPLHVAIREAVLIAGAASKGRVKRSPLIEVVEGRAAIDLELFGQGSPRSFLSRLDPRPSIRRLLASWRVGRLRAALPTLAADLVQQVDAELDAVPHMSSMDETTLIGILHSSRRRLIALHGHEVLAGLVMSKSAPARGAAGVALRSVAAGRHREESDGDIIVADPTVLALIPPRIPPETVLPPIPTSVPELPRDVDGLAQAREDLRLRARWMQELTARAAWELGYRLAAQKVIRSEQLIRWIRLRELPEIVAGDVVPLALEDRIPGHESAPLPTAFRLDGNGRVVPETSGLGNGQAAGGGRVTGTVRSGDEEMRPGDVLVVRYLDPKLAPLLPGLGGLVAETGSVLSHLAILAREYGIPTVVGVHDAVQRFPSGTTVLVDGTIGRVLMLDEEGVP